MKKIILFMILMLIPLAYAETSTQYTSFDFKRSCVDDNQSYCDASVNCTLTFNDPNSVNILDNAKMSWSQTYYNYTILGSSLNEIGTYTGTMRCSSTLRAKTESVYFDIERKLNQTNIITIDRCPLEEDNNFLIGYFLIIALLFVMLILNETIFKIPFMSFLMGFSFVVISIPLYACSAILGVPLTVFGMMLFVWEIMRFRDLK